MNKSSLASSANRLGMIVLTSAAIFATNASHARNLLWVQQQTPFKIYGNTYYVGTRGLSSVLVISEQGHVIIDGALPESAAAIAANIRSLGYALKDVKLIVNSHAHSDHAGGIAELQKLTGAIVISSPAGAAALKAGRGGKQDPQFEYGDSFPGVREVKSVKDGETVQAGGLLLTVHYTPGHTPGGTSWRWKSCEQNRCMSMVYVDSLTAVSDDSFRFTGDPRYPSALEDFNKSLQTVETLPCDILIAAHPEFADLWSRLERHEAGVPDAFVDGSACEHYVATARKRLEDRIARERAQPE